jgi:hypothetical protein
MEVSEEYVTTSSGSKNKAKKKPACACYLIHAGFVLGLYFDSEDGGDMFLQNIG